ncbi:MAG: 3-deoxy-D-manno-octulosonic acid transferase [Croceitalea sp.]|nr:3-deoxy-D-manno-octulosonic acid transferase [Croceitalea sp.]
MRLVYTVLVHITWFHLKLIAFLKPKLRLFVAGRKNVFESLQDKIKAADKVIWMHVASLGEYEQGLPVLERIKKEFSDHKLLLTFFSPSGYEVKKDASPADIVVYLPMDTLSNSKKFLALSHPELAIFIKYEIWPNYLHQLKKNQIPTLLVSALFSLRQIYFKPWGGFMRKSLHCFDYIFVQDDNSKKLLKNIGMENVSVSGDTRFDRVIQITERDNSLKFMDQFTKDQKCLVAGSTWPEDERLLTTFINEREASLKWVIAPHNIKKSHIINLKSSLPEDTLLLSEISDQNLANCRVLIIDTIGVLTKIYSYADMAYVGGGFATGLHNTLEAAVFGVPVLIGPNFKNFKEAESLVEKKGILVITGQDDFDEAIIKISSDENFRKRTGIINSEYVAEQRGATDRVFDFIKTII